MSQTNRARSSERVFQDRETRVEQALHFAQFVLLLRNQIRCSRVYAYARMKDFIFVSQDGFHARQAAMTLLKMARTTSDPDLAARLIEAAADLKDQTGELPPRLNFKAPDVQANE